MKGAGGYEPDPVRKMMTGWILKHRPDLSTPPYADAPFKSRATLVRRH